MTAEEYAKLAADAQAKIGEIITSAAPKAIVVLRDPVDLNSSEWVGSLMSGADLDAGGKKRVHAWVVTFAGSTDPESGETRCIEPTLSYRVQFYYSHWFKKGSAGPPAVPDTSSEEEARAEVLKVQFALAQSPRLGVANMKRHKQLSLPVRLKTMKGGSGDVIVHHGDGEIAIEVAAVVVG